MKAVITITPKSDNIQGGEMRRAAHHLGMACVESVRCARRIELEISGSNLEKTRAKLEEVTRQLWVNPEIEEYTIELNP